MRQLKGKVLSQKMTKSAVVEVSRFWTHPIYKKRIKKTKKYLVHNEIKVKDGDPVIIQECRPISKKKRFELIKVIINK
ncbi:30S ribosomal protein S17 [Candidatus Beckwithbacteria bacterium CG10_big_fil_rev_8_21_14_0_10_34_10]|uniref:Small ribosomal subunit protein uS17 n=1 Tax=Candidatus Beckwithbacteria bacterium CG10_big_fil_rev_8_21_14_0_10_34_10 TaxID=1974495 RepID=A0A2H0W821_9BACT|nr:MAG: 30S ribosomal protein S17 [Candidatus Beckwithbacteria bacterium CG10_big_fil_rev_8_21_14_0_10_34_10]